MTRAEQNNQSSSAEIFLGPNTLELLGVNDKSAITILNPWHQGGAETYVTDFEVDRGENSVEHLIAKACIKFGPKEAMNEWLERRRLMQENGVLFPKVSAVDGATLIEEYIPFAFKEAYVNSGPENRERLRERYITTYKRIYGAGFTPTSLHDVRSHGDDVVVIDVGEDIGGHKSIDVCDLSVIVKAEASFRNIIS